MTPRRPANSRPAFLERLHARQQSHPLSWLDGHAVILLLAGAAFIALVWLLSPILTPFLAAAILAYIFAPFVNALEKKGVPRSLATLLAVLVMLLAVALLLVVVMPLFYREIAQLTQQLPNFAEQLKARLLPWMSNVMGININLDANSFRQFVTDNLQDAKGIAGTVFSSVRIGGLAVVGFLINLLLVPVVLFYLLRDWRMILAKLDAALPRGMHGTVTKITREIDGVLSEFLRGQLAVMLVMAVFYVTGLWAVGLYFALPVGLITGLLVFVPYLGSGAGLLLGTIAAVMQFPSINGIVLVWVVFGAGQLIEGFVITPRLVGKRIGLHPVAVIFALLAFGQVFGFFGVLLALPASAALLVGLRHVAAKYRGSSLYRR
jgi:predicted PurR-regulated permease PerM